MLLVLYWEDIIGGIYRQKIPILRPGAYSVEVYKIIIYKFVNVAHFQPQISK